MSIKIEWPFGPKITCAKCGKKFRYRGTEDDDALDGALAYCDECTEAIKQQEASAALQVAISTPTFDMAASAPVIHEEIAGESAIDKAVQMAIRIANDNSNGYSMPDRYGVHSFDCSSLVIRCCREAGIPTGIANTTHDMYEGFMSSGWQDVTCEVNRTTGSGLIRGDVLLNMENHTVFYIGDGKVVNARTDSDGCVGDSHGDEIRIQNYWNFPWDYILRWPSDGKCRPVLLDVDGEFGPRTEAALRQYQKDNGLIDTGAADNGTWANLISEIEYQYLQNGSAGDRVSILQAMLNIYNTEEKEK